MVEQGDITRVAVDAIVNAANSGLLGGGGVDGAIHQAGGPEIMAECDQIRADQGGCPTGQAVITTAGKLPAKYVIHTAGPVYKDGSDNEALLLSSCYKSCLDLAQQHGVTSISFPNISTGVYHFPKQLAASTAVDTVRDYFTDKDSCIKRVIFVCFDDENFQFYRQLI